MKDPWVANALLGSADIGGLDGVVGKIVGVLSGGRNFGSRPKGVGAGSPHPVLVATPVPSPTSIPLVTANSVISSCHYRSLIFLSLR